MRGGWVCGGQLLGEDRALQLLADKTLPRVLAADDLTQIRLSVRCPVAGEGRERSSVGSTASLSEGEKEYRHRAEVR
jgi:hypothetical protein